MPSDPRTRNRLLPETDPALLKRFRTEDPREILALLAELTRARVPVALNSPRRPDAFLLSRLLACDPSGLTLDFIDDPLRADRLGTATDLVAVAIHQGVKLQFEVSSVRRTTIDDGPALLAALPAALVRLQRREDFRVRPPATAPLRCVIRDGTTRGLELQVIDISAGGLSVLVAADIDAPAQGAVLIHSRLESASLDPVPCDLEVVSVAAMGDGTRQLGLRFVTPGLDTQRAVQRYVLDTQRIRLAAAAAVRPACS